ncbi:MAG: hypothetical protein LBQ09_07365, partial [Acidobacteriaceae bacterium]|nr:hypothetical protein [Acidobacteriaceae bacterium]
FVVAGAIRVGYGINIGIGFAPWGWGTTRFGWNERVMYVNNAPWRRTWTNRTAYVHPYTVPHYNGGNTARPMPRGNGNNTGPRYNGSATAPYAVPRGNGGNAVPYAMPRGNGNNGSGGNTSASRYNGRVNGAQAPRSGGSREQNADRSGQRSSNGRTAERRGGGSRGR